MGRDHRRLRRRARRRRAADHPRAAGAHDRPAGASPIKATLQQAADQHRRHRADRRDGRAASTRCSPRASSTTCSSAGCSGRCGRDHARRAVRRRHRAADRRAGVLPVRRRRPAHPGRHQPRGVRRPRRARSRPTPSRSSPGVEHINRTGGVVAGALPLLYGMAEGIVVGATYEPAADRAATGPPRLRAPPVPAARRRRLPPYALNSVLRAVVSRPRVRPSRVRLAGAASGRGRS